MALDAYPEAYGEFKQLMVLLLMRDEEEERIKEEKSGEERKKKKSSSNKDKHSDADQQQQQPASSNILSEMYIVARRAFMKLKVIECMFIPHLGNNSTSSSSSSSSGADLRSFVSKMVEELRSVQVALSSYTNNNSNDVVMTGEQEALLQRQLNIINREINSHFDLEEGELGTPEVDTCWPLNMKLVAARFTVKQGDNSNNDDDKNNKGNLSSSAVVPPRGIPPTPKKATREGRYEFAAAVARMVREGLASSLSDSSFSLIMRQLLLVARYNIGTKLANQFTILGRNIPDQSGVERTAASGGDSGAWCFHLKNNEERKKHPNITSTAVPEPFSTELNVISSNVYRDGGRSYSFEEAYKHITDHIPPPSLGHILPPGTTTNNNNSGPSSIPTMNIANLRTALLCDTPTAIALLRRQQYKQQQYNPPSSSFYNNNNNNILFSGTGVTSSSFNNQYTTSNWGPRTALIHGIQAIPLHYKGPTSVYGAIGGGLASQIAKDLLPPPPTMKKKNRPEEEDGGGNSSSGDEQRMELVKGIVGVLTMCIEAACGVMTQLDEKDTINNNNNNNSSSGGGGGGGGVSDALQSSNNSSVVLIDWLKDLAAEYAEYRGLRHVSPICHLPAATNNDGEDKKSMCIAVVKTKAAVAGGNAVNRRHLSGHHHHNNNNRKDATTHHHHHQKLYKLPFLEDEDESSSSRERGQSSHVLLSYQGIIIHSSSKTETAASSNEEDGTMCILTPPPDNDGTTTATAAADDDDDDGRLVTIAPHFPDINWTGDDDEDEDDDDVMDIDQTNNNKRSSSNSSGLTSAAAEGEGGGRRKRRDADKSPPTKAARHTISGNCVHNDDDSEEEEGNKGDKTTSTTTTTTTKKSDATTIKEKIHHVDKLMHSVWTLLSPPSSSSLTCDNIDTVVELMNTKQPGLLDTWTCLHFYLLRIKVYIIMMSREEEDGGKEGGKEGGKGGGKGGGGGCYDAMEALKLVRTELSPLAEMHKKKGGQYGGDEDELRDALKAALIEEVLPLKPLSGGDKSGGSNNSNNNSIKEGEMVVMMRKRGRAKVKSEVRRVSCMVRTALLNYNDIPQPRLIDVLEKLFCIHDEYLAGQRISRRNSLAMQALNIEAWLGNGTSSGLLSLPPTTTLGGGGATTADAGRADMEIDSDDDFSDDDFSDDDGDDDDDNGEGQPPHHEEEEDEEEGRGAEFSDDDDDGDDEFPDQWISMTMEFSGLQRGLAIEMLHRYGDPESVLHHLFP